MPAQSVTRMSTALPSVLRPTRETLSRHAVAYPDLAIPFAPPVYFCAFLCFVLCCREQPMPAADAPRDAGEKESVRHACRRPLQVRGWTVRLSPEGACLCCNARLSSGARARACTCAIHVTATAGAQSTGTRGPEGRHRHDPPCVHGQGKGAVRMSGVRASVLFCHAKNAWRRTLLECARVHTHIHTHTRTHTHTHTHTQVCHPDVNDSPQVPRQPSTLMCIDTHTHIMCMCVCIHTYKHTCIHTYMHACMHTHARAHTHTHITGYIYIYVKCPNIYRYR